MPQTPEPCGGPLPNVWFPRLPSHFKNSGGPRGGGHEGRGRRGRGRCAPGGSACAAPPARPPGQPTMSRPMERRGLGLGPDLGPPPTPALLSAAVHAPRLLSPQLQKLFMRSTGWWLARWEFAPGRGSLCGLNDSIVGLWECCGERTCSSARVSSHPCHALGTRAGPPAPRVLRRALLAEPLCDAALARPSPRCTASRLGGENFEGLSGRAAGLGDALFSADRPYFTNLESEMGRPITCSCWIWGKQRSETELGMRQFFPFLNWHVGCLQSCTGRYTGFGWDAGE